MLLVIIKCEIMRPQKLMCQDIMKSSKSQTTSILYILPNQ